MDKIAIISDIHGNLEALKTVLNDINNRGITKIYCLGGRRRKLRKVLTTLIEDGKVFFATNEDGAIFKNFMMRALEIEKNPLI